MKKTAKELAKQCAPYVTALIVAGVTIWSVTTELREVRSGCLQHLS